MSLPPSNLSIIELMSFADWITYPFGLYSSVITGVADTEGTLYTAIGWGCLINAFYVVSILTPRSVSSLGAK